MRKKEEGEMLEIKGENVTLGLREGAVFGSLQVAALLAKETKVVRREVVRRKRSKRNR